MTSRRTTTLILAALTHLLLSTVVQANDTPIRSVGKAIQPRTDVPVRLVSEKVDITITGDKAFVSCTFNLLNDGPLCTVDVGFPRGGESDLNDFIAVVGTDTVDVTTISSDPVYIDPSNMKMPWWKTFKVPFNGEGRPVVVRNSYWTRLGPSTQQRLSHLLFTYIMTTGAPWKGTIGEAIFTIHLDGIDSGRIVEISPNGYRHDDESLVWRFTDFEPTENIEIKVMEKKVYERLVSAREMLKNNSDDAQGHYLLGTVYWIEHFSSTGADDYRESEEKAQKEFLRAVELDTTLNDARWYLATLYDNRREKMLWREQLEAIVKNEPLYRCRDELFYLQFIDELNEFRADKWLNWQTKRGR